ncbi:glycosyltransferase, partial [Pontibaca methylaminivorans]|uniref:glycosyltransferase n=1 Tax=Pontibaca methylaminivorans TaxID=515897 RepID=UPI002FDB5EF9
PPKIDAKHIKVIDNQPPMSDYTEEGIVRYRLADCAENIRHYFGKDATWHPIGPLVRDALHSHHAHELHHIDLSPEDWHNIIDINGWDRGPRRRGPSDRLRIGRHSRDQFVKWPATREDTLAAYPASDDIEVHVLGGAEVPASLIGQVPDNWTVHPFGSMHPRDFLAGIDVFVYFAHPDWVESFGRTIIEAMANGVPVILPEVYRPLFEDAAIYATPQTAVKKARKLHSDPAAYAAQVEKAQRYAAQKFSYEMHIDRLNRSTL